ncbi:MAG: rhodanese-like domain-containing protein [Acidobacteriota bacterium]|nr:rhodanese-like domain-containing protein [Acidobacteriota bacterium]MDH3529464.1 rhodanese-like domain-containing protein [Acidobacteriota bacterium]
MKILTILGVGLLLAALGCQSAETPVAKAAPQSERAADRNVIADPDDHSHLEDEKKAPRITLEDSKKAFDDGSAVFVDTRGSAFYSNEHVKGAINVPSSDFENTYKSVPKNKKIITYCS